MSTSNLPTIQTRLKQPYQDSICIHCKAAVEWLKPESGAGGDEGVILQCVSCRGTWVVRPPPTRTGKGNGKRRIGTGEFTGMVLGFGLVERQDGMGWDERLT